MQASPAPATPSTTAGHHSSLISEQEFQDICGVLYANAGLAMREDLDRWCQQGIQFCQRPNYGLAQAHGGPCGVLAVIQAEIFAHLLFGYDAGRRPVSLPLPDSIPSDEARHALISAIATVLERIGEESGSIIVVTVGEQTALESGALLSFSQWRGSLLQKHNLRTRADLVHLLDHHLDQFHSDIGCLLLVLSATLTRYSRIYG